MKELVSLMDETAKLLKQLARDKVTYGQHPCCGRVANGLHSNECPNLRCDCASCNDPYLPYERY